METTDYCFSFFRKPIQNIEPIRAVGIVDVYRYIIGHYAQPQTENLRLMQSSPEAKRYKATHSVFGIIPKKYNSQNEWLCIFWLRKKIASNAGLRFVVGHNAR